MTGHGMARAIASLGPIGHIGRAPGTSGSLAALACGAVLMRASPAAFRLAALGSVVVGGLSVGVQPEAMDDPGWMVIDEVAGQWIAMLGLRRASAPGLLAAFVLFRLLDIAKPGPVGWADRRRGAVGVMGDDVIAGAIAAGLLAGTRWIGDRV